MAGQIIIVNGTSGSGKSTACELFAKQADDFWLVYGIDHFMASTFPRAYSHSGARTREGIYTGPLNEDEPDGTLRWHMTEQALQAFGVFHEWVATAARNGCNIIIDHLLLADPPLLQDCIWRLQDVPVLLVNLKPPYEVLAKRVEERQIGSRFSNSKLDSEQIRQTRERLARLRPWFYQAIYANPLSDLEINTDAHSPQAVCEMMAQALAQGPGTAFAQLRDKYPR